MFDPNTMQPDEPKPLPTRAFRPARWAVGSILLFVFVIVDSGGGPQFTDYRVNHVVSLAACLLPLVSFVFTLKCRRGFLNVIALTLLLPIAALTILGFLWNSVSLVAVITGRFGDDLAFRTVHVGRSTIRAYRDSAGAFDSFHTTVVEERPIVPGIAWVKPLDIRREEPDARIEVVDRNHVRLRYPGHGKPYSVVVRISG